MMDITHWPQIVREPAGRLLMPYAVGTRFAGMQAAGRERVMIAACSLRNVLPGPVGAGASEENRTHLAVPNSVRSIHEASRAVPAFGFFNVVPSSALFLLRPS